MPSDELLRSGLGTAISDGKADARSSWKLSFSSWEKVSKPCKAPKTVFAYVEGSGVNVALTATRRWQIQTGYRKNIHSCKFCALLNLRDRCRLAWFVNLGQCITQDSLFISTCATWAMCRAAYSWSTSFVAPAIDTGENAWVPTLIFYVKTNHRVGNQSWTLKLDGFQSFMPQSAHAASAHSLTGVHAALGNQLTKKANNEKVTMGNQTHW